MGSRRHPGTDPGCTPAPISGWRTFSGAIWIWQRSSTSMCRTMRCHRSGSNRATCCSWKAMEVRRNSDGAHYGRAKIEDCVHQNHILKVRAERNRLLPEYAMAWFNTPCGKDHFFKNVKTSSGLGTINSTELKAAPLPLPDLNVQGRTRQCVARGTAQRRRFARESHNRRTDCPRRSRSHDPRHPPRPEVTTKSLRPQKKSLRPRPRQAHEKPRLAPGV